jgi:hypothetical protein
MANKEDPDRGCYLHTVVRPILLPRVVYHDWLLLFKNIDYLRLSYDSLLRVSCANSEDVLCTDNAASLLHFFCFWKELLALKKASWLKELRANGVADQCRSCQHHHAQSSDPQEQSEAGIGHGQVQTPREQDNTRTVISDHSSWLPPMFRRQRKDTHDLEASIEPPEQPACLITPLASDQSPVTTYGATEGSAEEIISHRPGSENLVKKKVRKGRKESSRCGAERNENDDVAEQPAAVDGQKD